MKAALVLNGVFCIATNVAAALTLDALPPDPDKVALPAVPKVMDAGESGFPELPTVSSMLDDSSAVLSSISSRASQLQKEMNDVEVRNAARLQRQKVVFDKKLRDQEENNVLIVKENAQLAKQILKLKKENQAELKGAKNLQNENNLRQQQLTLLNEQLSTSQAFLANTMKVADDSKAEELQVLNEQSDSSKAEAPFFLQLSAEEASDASIQAALASADSMESTDTRRTEEGQATLRSSMLQEKASNEASIKAALADSNNAEPTDILQEKVSSDASMKAALAASPNPESSSILQDSTSDDEAPESLLTMLEAGIKDMKNKGKKSEEKLKELFISHFQAGVKRHKALIAQQEVLKTTIKTMTAYRGRLEAAVKHLTATQGTVTKSLHDASLFLKRLSQLSASTPEEGVRRLSDLKTKEADSTAGTQ